MADGTPNFWQCPELLARAQDVRDRLTAWRQLGSAAHLLPNCQRAIEAGEDVLLQAWPFLQEEEVDRFVRYHASEAVDADRLVRAMRGFFAAALTARAARLTDPASLLRWLHEAAALWGGFRPTEGLTASLSPAAGAVTRFESARREGWPEAIQPARVLDDHFRALARFPGGWRVGAARDCAAVLLGSGRRIARRLALPVLGFGGGGSVLRLGVELLHDGVGECYPDPLRMGLLPMTGSFLSAAETAWAEAQREAGADPVAGYDARWWVVAPDGGAGPQVLEGPSMGAALTVALIQLLRGHPLDPEVALTAEILTGGTLKKVDEVHAKARAAFALPRPLKYIVVHPDNLDEVQRAAVEAKRDPNDSVRRAATLAEALRHVSGLPTDMLRYYNALVAAPEGDKGDPAPVYGGRALTDLFVTPDFLRINLDRARESSSRQQGGGETAAAGRAAGPEVRDLNEETLFGEAGSGQRLTWAEARGEWAREGARVVVLGAPGQGKSVLTQMLAREVAREGQQRLAGDGDPARLEDLPLPVVVPLNLLLEKGLPEGRDPDRPLRAALVATLTEMPDCTADAAHYLAEHAHEGRTWLILDALDEVGAEAVGACDRLFEVLRRPEWRCRVLITTRPYGYEPARVRLEETLFRLAPLSANQEGELIDKWFCGDTPVIQAGRARVAVLRTRPAVQGMAQNAFLLSLLCSIAERGEVPADVTRTQLYEWALCKILGNQERADAWMPLLRALAWSLFRTHDRALLLSNERLLHMLRKHPDVPDIEANPAQELNRQQRAHRLRDELRRKRLLVAVGARRAAMFAHRTFAEYLAASYLAGCLGEKCWEKARVRWGEEGKKRSVADLLDHKAWLPAWQEVIVFLGGLLERPRPLIELLADVSPGAVRDDDFRHRLALASRSLAERPERDRAGLVDLVDRVTTQHFGLWWQRACDGTLSAVPHLTAALPLLAVLNGKLDGEGVLAGKRSLLDHLAELLRNKSGDLLRRTALEAVRALGPAAATTAILVRLAERLCDRNPDVRKAAVEAVGRVGAATTDAFLARLTKLLHDDNPSVRKVAARAVGALGAVATDTIVARLAKLLGDVDAGVRHAAVETAGTLLKEAVTDAIPSFWEVSNVEKSGTLGTEAVTDAILPRLDELVHDVDPRVRQAVARVLGRLREAATAGVLGSLAELLRDKDTGVRTEAVLTVEWLEAANDTILDRLLGLLREDDRRVRHAAIRAVKHWWLRHAAVGTVEQLRVVADAILNRLPDLLRDGALEGVLLASEVVRRLGAGVVTDAFLDRLTELLRDGDWHVAHMAEEVIEALGRSAATEAIQVRLGGLLRDNDACLRSAAVRAVARLGAVAANADILDRLAELLRDQDAGVRQASVWAAKQLGAVATAPIQAHLTRLLDDKDAGVRSAAVEAVGTLGAGAVTEIILPCLGNLVKDGDPRVRQEVAGVLGNLREAVTGDILGSLATLLGDRDADVRTEAAGAVGRLGAAAGTADILDPLAQLIRDDKPNVRKAAEEAVVALGEVVTDAFLTRLADLLSADDAGVRHAAVEAVGTLGAGAATKAILDPLAGLLCDKDAGMRQAAARATGRLGEAAATNAIVARLVDLLSDDDPRIRNVAADAVGTLGKATEPFLARLAQSRHDDDPAVRRAAVEAVRIVTIATAKRVLKEWHPSVTKAEVMWPKITEALRGFSRETITEVFLDCVPDLLSDNDRIIRYQTPWLVSWLGRTAAKETVISGLLQLLRDDNSSGNDWAACRAVGALGKATVTEGRTTVTEAHVSYLGNLLSDDRLEVRKKAADAVQELGKGEGSLRFWGMLPGGVGDSVPQLRAQRVEELGR